MRTRRLTIAWIALSTLAVGCDEPEKGAQEPALTLEDHCAELVTKVKEQCGEDSPAYKAQKRLYLDNAPAGEPESDADAQMRVRRLLACKAGLASANEKLDYSEPPSFFVGSDPEMQQYAEQAKQHYEARKAAYEKMTPEERKKDEAAQIEQRCQLWVLG